MPSFVMLTAYWAETPVLIPVDDIRLVATRRRRTPSEIEEDLRRYGETLERLTESGPPADLLDADAIPRHQEMIARYERERDAAESGSVVVLKDRDQTVLEDVETIAGKIARTYVDSIEGAS